jgi:tRNA A-37 threonylcarbamoyl transferase component Bud32
MANLANHPRYQLLRKLGEGGMGAVFLAEHRHMHRLVALKVIRMACLSHPNAVERFRREVRTAAQLNHPNIVTAHDADESGGVHFLVMEYVEGLPLGTWLEQHGPLPIAEACEYVRQAALGLQNAHERGMVHRDLKPDNLMRASDGTIKILDFGLARFAQQGESPVGEMLTWEGAVVGTPDYMAPEQASDSRQADVRADIYSLGCTLYQLLAGRVPFPHGSSLDKIVKHATEKPQPLAELRRDLPDGLVAIVERMMAKSPAERFQAPVEVAAALTPFTDTSLARVAARRSPRRAVRIAAAFLAVLILAAMAAVTIKVVTPRGEFTIATSDPRIEVITRNNGDIVRIRDRETKEVWELDTLKLNLRRADDDDGLRIDLNGRGSLVLRRRDDRVAATIGGPGSPASVEIVEKGVLDFAEIHYAVEKRFDEWIAKLKKDGYRPVSLTIQMVEDAPRYSAVAVKEEKHLKWDLSRCAREDDEHIDRWWKKSFSAYGLGLYRNEGQVREVYLWKASNGEGDAVWVGKLGNIEDDIREAKKEGTRMVQLCAVDVGDKAVHGIILWDPLVLPWANVTEKSLSEVKAWLAMRKEKGWRPETLCAHGSGARTAFASIVVHDPDGPTWDVSWSLAPAEYEKAVVARKSLGYRPHSTVGHTDEAGSQRFSTIWIRYGTVPGATSGARDRKEVADAPVPLPDKRAPPKPTDMVVEKGVSDFAEIHGADQKQFDAWIAKTRKDGLRPVSLDVQTVKETPRYTAVAIEEEEKRGWELTRIPHEDNSHVGVMWNKQFTVVAMSLYRNDGKLWEDYLWLADSPRNDGVWVGDAPFIADKMDGLRKRNKRPIQRCALDMPRGVAYGVVLDDDGGRPWTEAVDLSIDECKTFVEKKKGENWQPESLWSYSARGKSVFGVVLAKDPGGPAREATWSLSAAEYEKELAGRRRRGFRPLSVVGHVESGEQLFSTAWIRYRDPGYVPRTEPQLSVPGLKPVKVLADDDFQDPQNSLFKEAITDAPRMFAFDSGHFVMRRRTAGWIGWSAGPSYRGFVCQVAARIAGEKQCSWGISVNGTPSSRAFKVMVRPDGQVLVTPTPWTSGYLVPAIGPFKPPEGYRPGEFNTLAVSRRGRVVSVCLNGRPVGEPIVFEQPTGMSKCGLIVNHWGTGEVRAEFQRFTVWQLPSPVAK